MTDKVHGSPHASARILAQVLFFTVAFTIIIDGLWSLYMSDAPYHPDIVMSESEIYLAQE